MKSSSVPPCTPGTHTAADVCMTDRLLSSAASVPVVAGTLLLVTFGAAVAATAAAETAAAATAVVKAAWHRTCKPCLQFPAYH